MTGIRDFQVVVLGSGPVGMVAALELSKHYRTALITSCLPSAELAPRVEAVPASLLALLVEYGIHPKQIGVDRLHETRLISWEKEGFTESVGPVSAHVERPALDLALLSALVASKRVNIILGQQSETFSKALAAARNHKVRLIDATGRRSLSAKKKIQPARPWAARTLFTSRRSCSGSQEFRICALPGGFVFRLGAADYIVLGIVGRGKTVAGNPHELDHLLHEYGAAWILEGLPRVAEMTQGGISPASVQWTIGDAGTRIGDAALARDTLSSQGLACGISEALYAAAIRDDEGGNLFSLRQFEQRTSHLRALSGLIARCRCRDEVAWREYAAFISGHLLDENPVSSVALRTGQLQRLSAHHY
ncbi:MAG TPA: hypothetical protein VHE60_14330 [Pyrinomonadaceae bacterium]|nr:hypothetical protein [Pyrinomonadaceae bacterium]